MVNKVSVSTLTKGDFLGYNGQNPYHCGNYIMVMGKHKSQ